MSKERDAGVLVRGAPGTVLLGLVLVTAAAAAEPPVADASSFKQSLQRFAKIEPGATLRVINHHGNVYARFGGYEPQVEVLATIQRLDRDLPELELRIRRTEPGLEVVVDAGEGDAPRRDRADLVVFVPKGIRLDVETLGDQIEAKKLKSDLTAASISGEIRIRSVAGRVQAKSARGRISAMLQAGATDASQSFATETGEIEVYVPEDAGMNVRLATSGEISTDYSIQIEHRRFEEPGKHGVAVIGAGGPELRLTSKRGWIRLLRQQTKFRPDESESASEKRGSP